ncbi:hypothetical protein M1295_00090 [Patescibacteria group bacterium]|nr:hypothetical protein [Patescibacteria group bacterium]
MINREKFDALKDIIEKNTSVAAKMEELVKVVDEITDDARREGLKQTLQVISQMKIWEVEPERAVKAERERGKLSGLEEVEARVEALLRTPRTLNRSPITNE